mmetsp:Transcript_9097/g.37519  ORF Transcript_9097/g.37519 Transcript_9097/m.37519 type:complete len:352 (-) Transcript_9097:382-1437(-)
MDKARHHRCRGVQHQRGAARHLRHEVGQCGLDHLHHQHHVPQVPRRQPLVAQQQLPRHVCPRLRQVVQQPQLVDGVVDCVDVLEEAVEHVEDEAPAGAVGRDDHVGDLGQEGGLLDAEGHARVVGERHGGEDDPDGVDEIAHREGNVEARQLAGSEPLLDGQLQAEQHALAAALGVVWLDAKAGLVQVRRADGDLAVVRQDVALDRLKLDPLDCPRVLVHVRHVVASHQHRAHPPLPAPVVDSALDVAVPAQRRARVLLHRPAGARHRHERHPRVFQAVLDVLHDEPVRRLDVPRENGGCQCGKGLALHLSKAVEGNTARVVELHLEEAPVARRRLKDEQERRQILVSRIE